MARTVVLVLGHIAPLIEYLDNACSFPVVEWTRPEGPNERYVDPPFASVRPYPSAEEFAGPIADSQADINLRIQILGTGRTVSQALMVTDIVRQHMFADLRTSGLREIVEDRVVLNIKHMVVHGGVSRENDLPTPWFYSMDLYELMTTPE